MLPVGMLSPAEAALGVAGRVRALRLQRNWSQAGLAAAAGVSLGSLKRFERTGEIAFVSLIRLAVALDALAPLDAWFAPPPFQSIDEAIARVRPRRRGRRT